ncbi:MAG: Fic family protein [Acidobacteriota bacterium]
MKIPAIPPDFWSRLASLSSEKLISLMDEAASPVPGGEYHHWDTLRHKQPPEGLTHEEWWAAVKMARVQMRKNLPLVATDGQPFGFTMPDPVLEMIQKIDSQASGQIQISEEVTNPATRDRYVVDSLIEEAITSSQLEGASTTGRVAREMIRAQRRPRDRDERMILNNYRGMEEVRKLRGKLLTPQRILQLQEVLTRGTLGDPGGAGRLRTKDDDIKVWDTRDGKVLHVPPPAGTLPERLDALCEFANQRSPDYFVHPAIRAAILHFWVGYDHPFVDGNGRTARALFYWSMHEQGYWLCEFLSISSILRKAPSKYARAYLYSETDQNDVTYFIIYQLRVLLRAISALHGYLKTRMSQLRETEACLRESEEMNHRQIGLLSHALRHPGARYSIRSHQNSHGVSYMTARSDLLSLAERNFLLRKKVGKRHVFIAPEQLAEKLQAGG